MKKFKVILAILLFFAVSETQGQILNRVARKLKDKANQKVDEAIDKTLDKTTKTKSGGEDGNTQESNSGTPSVGKSNIKADGKFDFIPREKIVFWEDFSADTKVDFPIRWNTNAGGELVKIGQEPTLFLETKTEVIFYPESISKIPQNFTLEFDLIANEEYNYYSDGFVVGFSTIQDISKAWRELGKYGGGGANQTTFALMLDPTNAGGQQGESIIRLFKDGKESFEKHIDQSQFTTKNKTTKVHVSIWRQNQRLRVYLNDKKVWDLPKLFEPNVNFNSLYFRNNGASNDEDVMHVGNVKLAIGQADNRHKLLTEGKFSSHGILFEVNSDEILPASYAVIKEVAELLKENPAIRVNIVGHTDGDGEEAENLELSKKRALAVRKYMVEKFAIDESRLETDGKGESEPVEENTSPEKKAQNRRVEWIVIK